MQVIWYNSELKAYQHGDSQSLVQALSTSESPSSIKVVMKFNDRSSRLANKVLKQLNLVNQKMEETFQAETY